ASDHAAGGAAWSCRRDDGVRDSLIWDCALRLGRRAVDALVAEALQDTWIHFPWDTDEGLAFRPPLRDAGL
ncbi:MAG: hypothetical protein WBW35_18785, partial [Xanthobacteraceae bacterium]